MSDLVAIKKPLTRRDADGDGWVDGIVSVGLDDVVDNDQEGFLDILSCALVGDDLLMDIEYEVVGVGGGNNELLLKVSGDARMSFKLDEEDPTLEAPCVCDNCGYTDAYKALPPAQDLLRRVVVGELFTDKECPKCGALCFPKDKIICKKPVHEDR